MGLSKEQTPVMLDTENTPLLLKPAAAKSVAVDVEAPAPAREWEGPAREWEGHLLNPVGDCGKHALLTCAAGTWLPCLAHGYNARRALNLNLWLHALTFVGLFFAGRWLYAASVLNAEVACSPLFGHPLPPPPPHHPPHPPNGTHPHPPHPPHHPPHPENGSHPHPHPHPPHHPGDGPEDGPNPPHPPPGGPPPISSCHLLGNYWRVWSQAEAELLLPEGEDMVESTVRLEDLSPECHAAVGYSAGMHLLAVASVWAAIFWAASYRGLLRERFNIKGTRLGDVLAWAFCPLCALCQETRTLLKNRVEHGVWQGPAPTLPLSAAPAAQLMPAKPV